MSILTKTQVTKGAPAQFSLNKTELLQHPSVQEDTYFSDPLNWYRINVVYKSSEGSQYENVEFDATQNVPTGTFLVSEKARSSFEVLKIKILDFDGGFLEIERVNLVVSDFDVEAAPVTSFVMQGSGTITYVGGVLTKTDGYGDTVNAYSGNNVASGGASVEFEVSDIGSIFRVGLSWEVPPISNSQSYPFVSNGAFFAVFSPGGELQLQSFFGGPMALTTVVVGDKIKLQHRGSLLYVYKNEILLQTFDSGGRETTYPRYAVFLPTSQNASVKNLIIKQV